MCKYSFTKRIEDGIAGKYHGLPNGLNRFNKYIYAIQRKRYYLFGGLSGSAKTTLVDFMLLNALEYANRNNIQVDVFYYSFEIDRETKIANLISCHIYNKYKKVIPPQKILGFGKFRLNDEEKALVDSELDYIHNLFNKINFTFDSLNPTGIYKDLLNHYKKTGKFVTKKYTKTVVDKYGKEQQEEGELLDSYVHDNPDRYVICIIDHLALCKSENGLDVKHTIDRLSEYTVLLRNICGLTAMYIQQFNQGLNSVDRQKFKGVDISPQQNDFKDTTNTYQDCDCAIGIMNAYKMDMEECLGYNLSIFKNRFRMLKVIKNRGGYDNVSCGLLFIPEGGFFKELPLPKELNHDVYTKYTQAFRVLDEQIKQAGGDEDWSNYGG